jgi:hypothetical protein
LTEPKNAHRLDQEDVLPFLLAIQETELAVDFLLNQDKDLEAAYLLSGVYDEDMANKPASLNSSFNTINTPLKRLSLAPVSIQTLSPIINAPEANNSKPPPLTKIPSSTKLVQKISKMAINNLELSAASNSRTDFKTKLAATWMLTQNNAQQAIDELETGGLYDHALGLAAVGEMESEVQEYLNRLKSQ